MCVALRAPKDAKTRIAIEGGVDVVMEIEAMNSQRKSVSIRVCCVVCV